MQALISFGSNLGDSKQLWQQTLDLINDQPEFELVRTSSLVITKPVGGPEGQNEFLNATFILRTDLQAERIVEKLLQTESKLGRIREKRWGPRLVDLDLLLLEDVITNSDRCQVPHPRMTFRNFMLKPASEIAPNWVHPVCRDTLEHLFDVLPKIGNRVFLVHSENADPLNRLQKLTLDLPLTWTGSCSICQFGSEIWQAAENALVVFSCENTFESFRGIQKSKIGPYLVLPSSEPAQIQSELSAALSAMKSL